MAILSRKASLWIVGVPVAAWLLVVGVAGQRLWLVPSEPVQIDAVLSSSEKAPKVSMMLQPGQRLPINRCVDRKGFIEAEVILPDGRPGYAWLTYRNFIRQSVLAFWGAPLTYSCP